MPTLLDLLKHFSVLSLLGFGGGNATLPEMHRLVVEQYHWMTDTTFSQLFALAQAAPGPNVLVVTLLGLQLAGLTGALVITAAFCLPSSIVMYCFFCYWERLGDRPWRVAVQLAVAPMAVGLVLASGWLMAGTGGDGMASWLLTALTVLLALKLPWNPLWWIAGGSALAYGEFLFHHI